MAKQKQMESRKIAVALTVLVLLFVASLLIRGWKNGQVEKRIRQDFESEEVPLDLYQKEPVMYLETDADEVLTNDMFKVEVLFSAYGRKIDGSDVILKFDPLFLEADTSISQGEYFAYYPRVDVNNQTGEVKVSMYQPVSDETVNGEEGLFKVKFRAKKEGDTFVDFYFQEGRTDLTTLVEHGTSKNILKRVRGVGVEIVGR